MQLANINAGKSLKVLMAKNEVSREQLAKDLDISLVTASKLRKDRLDDSTLNSIVFDPPFLTYVRAARKGNGSMIMSNRFSGY